MPNIIELTDLASPEAAVFARLTEAQLRLRTEGAQGIFIAESPNVIQRALDAGYTPVSFLMERKHIEAQAAALLQRCGDCPVYTAPPEALAQLTGYPLTRGVLCAMARPVLPSAEALCQHASRLAILEGIVDSTNLGAIFRSAAALHIDAVLLTPTCTDPLYRRAARVSMGTVFQVPWTRLSRWPDAQMLRRLGFKTAAMALREDALSIEDPRLAAEERLAIILGTEGDGLAAHTIAQCDYTVQIPMAHGVDSLNVAAASAVAFWALRRR